jgi:hypothetical protein
MTQAAGSGGYSAINQAGQEPKKEGLMYRVLKAFRHLFSRSVYCFYRKN